jgi:hypothetical protein
MLIQAFVNDSFVIDMKFKLSNIAIKNGNRGAGPECEFEDGSQVLLYLVGNHDVTK